MDDEYDEEEIAEIAEELDDGEGVHLIPSGDIAVHEQSAGCHCNPKRIFRDNKRNVEVWLHKFLRGIIN